MEFLKIWQKRSLNRKVELITFFVVKRSKVCMTTCPFHSCERDISGLPKGNFITSGRNVPLELKNEIELDLFEFDGQRSSPQNKAYKTQTCFELCSLAITPESTS